MYERKKDDLEALTSRRDFTKPLAVLAAGVIFGGIILENSTDEPKSVGEPLPEDRFVNPKDVYQQLLDNENWQRYTIGKGDTIWSISGAYKGSRNFWEKVILDKNSIEYPEKLRPGKEILIPKYDLKVELRY